VNRRTYIATILLALSPVSGMACGCSKPHTVDAPIVDKYAAYIIEGTVKNVVPLERAIGKCASVTFQIDKLLRGPMSTLVTIDYCVGISSCHLEDIDFRIGEKYLTSATSSAAQSGAYSSNFCQLRDRIFDG